MRQLIFLGALISLFDGCSPPLQEPLDAAVADSGAPKPKPPPVVVIPPVDGGAETDGGVHFEKVASFAMRARSIWSLDGQAVWVVGDDNAVFRNDALGWKKLELPGSAGIHWREVRGDRASIWLLGERAPGEGSFLYVSRLGTIRRVPIESPRFVFADEREGLWVAGTEGTFGALVNSRDNGATWAVAALPDGPPIAGGWLDAYTTGTNPPSRLPSPLLFRTSGVMVIEGTTEWHDSWDISESPLTGRVFLWRNDDFTHGGLLLGERTLMVWEKPSEPARPVIIEDFVPAALWGVSREELWAAGGDKVVWTNPADAWQQLQFPGEDFVAVHGGASSDVWVVSRDGDVFHRVR